VHQGTFVGVARPGEPFLAVYGALALAGLVAGGGIRRAPAAGALQRAAGLPLLLAAALAVPFWHDLGGLAPRPGVDPAGMLARLQAASPAGDVLAPPYYAALARRRMVFDYADWTVWGMRTAAGAGRERDLADRLVGALEEGAYPLVAKDFRLDYVPGVAPALGRRYVNVGDDGDTPARRVAFFVPGRPATATSSSG
jgi:hypothetical protein